MIFKIIQFIVPLILVALGLFQTLVYLLLRTQIASWNRVSAEIIDSRYVDQLGPGGEDIVKGIVAYKYEFCGKEYVSEEPAIRGYEMFPNKTYEKQLTEKYRKGMPVYAYVHEEAPDMAYLEVAPLSRVSTIAAPMISVLGIALAYGFYTEVIQEWVDYIGMQYSILMHNRNA